MVAEPHRLSEQQCQVVLGSLMGDGNLSPNRRDRNGVRFRMGHGAKQVDYLDWKAALLGNIEHSRARSNAKGAVFVDFTPLPELGELQRAVYLGDGKKHLAEEYLKALTPLALAIWYMDDGGFTVRSKGLQQRTAGGSGRIEICVEAMSRGSAGSGWASYLRDTHGLDVTLTLARGAAAGGAAVLHRGVGEVPGAGGALRAPVDGVQAAAAVPRAVRVRAAVRGTRRSGSCRRAVLDVHVKPPTRSMHRFDIEVEGNHNYFVDGVMVHNSPRRRRVGRR